MREHGLQPALRRRFVATTDSNHDAPIFPDRPRELAVVDGPNQLWAADLIPALGEADSRGGFPRGRQS